MPLYTYECHCGQILDVHHSISEDPDIECKECKKIMQRKIAAPAIQFKGNGFYSKEKG